MILGSILREKNNIYGVEKSQAQGENVNIGRLDKPDLKNHSREKANKAIE